VLINCFVLIINISKEKEFRETLTLTVKLPDNTYVNKILILEEEAKKWKSNCEKAKSDLLMLVKEREEMENTLIGLRSYREDILKAQEVPRHGISYRNKIEDLEDEINMLKINCEDQKLYALEVKEQLNKLKEEILHAKNTMCSC
jgi:uncharacterized protein (DUF342 family)